ncbi:MAG: PAS domain S-box protein [Mariprofundus sp.]|nr:PAS domain S-box protein [Mariprofundus sp.]
MSERNPSLTDQNLTDQSLAGQFPLLDHIASGILAIDRDANIVLWNNNMEQWSAQPRQQVLGKSLFELFPRTAEDMFKVRIDEVLRGGAPIIFSAQLHHHLIPCLQANGEFRAQLVTVTWLNDHQIALFSIQDQSEQLRLIEQYKTSAQALKIELDQRQKLEQKNLQLATAINQAGEAIIITDQQGYLEYTNKAFMQQTGWSEDEIKKLSRYDALFDKNDIHLESQFNVLFNSGETWTGRKEIMRKDGSHFTSSISIAPIFGEDGKLTHHIVIQEDISQQLNMEEKFRHTQKQEALVTLIGGIAHDFNNLLAGLIGQVYLASREVADMPKTAERMKKIQAASQDASEIVKQLLTFARQGEHHAKEFSLKSFINEFVKLARHNVPESIHFSSTFESSNMNFRGDADQLQQSLLNIVQNAVEACAGIDEPHIEVNLSSFDGNSHNDLLKKYPVLRHGNFSHIEIRDNGNGIAEHLLDRIFDPFFSTKQLGSGLGLAMVMGCVRHHNGIIDVESNLTRGSCFHLFLPILGSNTAASAINSHATTRSANILLVDDDERVLEPTKELLECMGHHVTLACDGRVACDIFKQQVDHWDLLISDIVMPHMDGLAASKEMRLLRPDLPVIYATGYDQSLVTGDVRKMGNTILISKPFNPDKLDELINKMLK